MDKTKLKALGLSDPEIKIYTALLKNSPLSASQLSKNTGMYRPYVYDTLENLIGKGLVTYTIRKSKKEFECAPPNALKKLLKTEEEQLKQKQDVVDSLMPILQSMYTKPFSEFIIERFEGESAVKDFNNFLKSSKINEIYIYGKTFEFNLKKLKIIKIDSKSEEGIIIFKNHIAVFNPNGIYLIKNKMIYEIIKEMFEKIKARE